MPQPVQTGRDALELARRFGLVGKLPLQLDEVAVPVVLLSDLTQEREESEREPPRPAIAHTTATPQTLGNNGGATLEGTDNRVLLVLDRVTVDVAATLEVAMPAGTVIVAGSFEQFKDRRRSDAPTARFKTTEFANRTPGTPVLRMAAGTTIGGLGFIVPTDLSAPVRIGVVADAPDTAIQVTFEWREAPTSL